MGEDTVQANTPSEIDPVCGMTVDPATAPASLVHNGKNFYFCSPSCLQKFQASPEKYLANQAPASLTSAMASPGVRYTCPMHPEIVRDHPGSCPICGMALEPLTVAAEEGPNPELVDMSRRFWISLILSVPGFALSMSDVFGSFVMTHIMSARSMETG